jgi:acetyltransferase-like isoleucine patch superfamily enzyme
MKQSYFVHPSALVETADIGPETRVWAFCHVMPGVRIGRACNLGDHVFVEGGVRIGDDVVIKNGVSVWEGVTLEDRVFVGPNVSFTNDVVPRAKVFHSEPSTTLVKHGASIGANATLICPVEIGRGALVGAGAVVTRDVPDFGLVVGNPARLIGYVCYCGRRLAEQREPVSCECGRRFINAPAGIKELL